jgi:hypothetical protein
MNSGISAVGVSVDVSTAGVGLDETGRSAGMAVPGGVQAVRATTIKMVKRKYFFMDLFPIQTK